MRLPGITHIRTLPADCLPFCIDLISVSGQAYDLATGADYTAAVEAGQQYLLCLAGEAQGETKTHNTRYGTEHTVTITFPLEVPLTVTTRRCFLVTTADHGTYLIGTRETQPAIEQTEQTSPHDGRTFTEVKITMTAHRPLVRVAGLGVSDTDAPDDTQRTIQSSNTDLYRIATEAEINALLTRIMNNE